VGIAVAQATLDVAVRPSGEHRQLAQTAAGLEELLSWLQVVQPQLLVLAATGGYDAPRVAHLRVARWSVAVVNARPVRDCARASGRLAKTAGFDAQTLAHCAQALRPQPRPLPATHTQELAARLERRRQVVLMRVAESPRSTACRPRGS
jgi:transposase